MENLLLKTPYKFKKNRMAVLRNRRPPKMHPGYCSDTSKVPRMIGFGQQPDPSLCVGKAYREPGNR